MVRFEVPTPTMLHLAILDVAVRRVSELADGFREAGVHEVLWDGRTAEGQQAANGIYFCKLIAGRAELTTRIVKLRRYGPSSRQQLR